VEDGSAVQPQLALLWGQQQLAVEGSCHILTYIHSMLALVAAGSDTLTCCDLAATLVPVVLLQEQAAAAWAAVPMQYQASSSAEKMQCRASRRQHWKATVVQVAMWASVDRRDSTSFGQLLCVPPSACFHRSAGACQLSVAWADGAGSCSILGRLYG
jgi:hypothetical protein